MEGAKAATQWYLRLILREFFRHVAGGPEELKLGQNPYALPWEPVICVVILGLFILLCCLWLYAMKEKNLAIKLCELMEEKCELLQKVSLAEKELEDLESSLKDASFEKGSTELVESLKATCEKLERSKSQLEDEILFVEKELQEEKCKHSEQCELRAKLSKTEQELKDRLNSLTEQLAEAKEACLTHQNTEAQRKVPMKDAWNENSQLQAHQKQLLQETESLKKQVCELKKQKITIEDSTVRAQQVLNDQEDHIQSLTAHLLNMTDWTAILGEDICDGDLELEMTDGSEKAAYRENQPKGALKKLMYAAKLNAYLKTLEGEKNQIETQLCEVNKINQDLMEHIKILQTEQACLQSQNTQLENDNQMLQHKVNKMTELYLCNSREQNKNLIAQGNCRLEMEEKLSKVVEKILRASRELKSYKMQARYLEKKMHTDILYYQNQVVKYEKKEQLSLMLVETSEKNLHYFKEKNEQMRQELIEIRLQTKLLIKHSHSPDVPHTVCGEEPCQQGLSPLDQPSSEEKAFLYPSETEFSRNDTSEDLGNSNVPDSSLPAGSQVVGPGFIPLVTSPTSNGSKETVNEKAASFPSTASRKHAWSL